MSIRNLFRPAYKSKDPEVRLKAVETLNDQSALKIIAEEDKSPRVRMAAIEKITDQDVLTQVALDGNEIDARIAAVERIDSQETLAEIIKLRKNYELMAACFSRITDKKILEAIANDPEYNMSARRIAIENYADEALLQEAIQPATGVDKPKTPEEIKELIAKYGGAQLVRALGRFRGSKGALTALGEIMRQGGEPAAQAVQYLAQALIHANKGVRQCAEDQLATISKGELVAELVRYMDKTELHKRILAVLEHIEHPDARQIITNKPQ
ncbi:MAG: HEAT repeat domain-containing protein [Candidatus Hatepunaea meridiana]|nr:HEAT repeat domain-containing protein [Candidatus Hatepunaea meridiana]